MYGGFSDLELVGPRIEFGPRVWVWEMEISAMGWFGWVLGFLLS